MKIHQQRHRIVSISLATEQYRMFSYAVAADITGKYGLCIPCIPYSLQAADISLYGLLYGAGLPLL